MQITFEKIPAYLIQGFLMENTVPGLYGMVAKKITKDLDTEENINKMDVYNAIKFLRTEPNHYLLRETCKMMGAIGVELPEYVKQYIDEHDR